MYRAAQNDAELAASMGEDIDCLLAAVRRTPAVERVTGWTIPGMVTPEPCSLIAADIRASMERGDWRVTV